MKIKDLNNRNDLQLVTDSQSVEFISSYFEKDFDGYFVDAWSGQYISAYGFYGIVPLLEKEVHKIV